MFKLKKDLILRVGEGLGGKIFFSGEHYIGFTFNDDPNSKVLQVRINLYNAEGTIVEHSPGAILVLLAYWYFNKK